MTDLVLRQHWGAVKKCLCLCAGDGYILYIVDINPQVVWRIYPTQQLNRKEDGKQILVYFSYFVLVLISYLNKQTNNQTRNKAIQ